MTYTFTYTHNGEKKTLDVEAMNLVAAVLKVHYNNKYSWIHNVKEK